MKLRLKPKSAVAAAGLAAVTLAFLAAGCSPSKPQQPTGQATEKAASADNPKQPASQKTCAIPPPTESGQSTTDAAGKNVQAPVRKIYTSDVAIPALWAKAKERAPDAILTDGYYGNADFSQPGDLKSRMHFGESRGAMQSWMATFYSPTKKQSYPIVFLDGAATAALPNDLDDMAAKYYENNKIVYNESDISISSCVAYETAVTNGLDDKNNYPIIRNGDWRAEKRFPGRKTWMVEEHSRTDTDGGKEPMGKTVYSYLIDAQTGEYLGKQEGFNAF